MKNSGLYAGLKINPSFRSGKRLLAFLNADPTNTEELKQFCKEYQIIPLTHLKGLLDVIVKEQTVLKNVVRNAIENKLTDKDLVIINSRLSDIHPAVRLLTSDEVIKVNDTLPRLEGDTIQENRQYLMKTSKHSGSLTSLWDDFVDYMVSMQPLKTCANCGQFSHQSNEREINSVSVAIVAETYTTRQRNITKSINSLRSSPLSRLLS